MDKTFTVRVEELVKKYLEESLINLSRDSLTYPVFTEHVSFLVCKVN